MDAAGSLLHVRQESQWNGLHCEFQYAFDLMLILVDNSNKLFFILILRPLSVTYSNVNQNANSIFT